MFKFSALGLIFAAVVLAACKPTPLTITPPNGPAFEAKFYPGAELLDDLIIIDDKVYYGDLMEVDTTEKKTLLQFVFKDGANVTIECTQFTVVKSKRDEQQKHEVCLSYKVINSDHPAIPSESTFELPAALYE